MQPAYVALFCIKEATSEFEMIKTDVVTFVCFSIQVLSACAITWWLNFLKDI